MFNNLKAPRFNPRKYRKNVVSQELYKKWKTQTESDLTFSQFKKIWEYIAEEYINTILEERDGAKLGNGMGDLYIGYIKNVKKDIVDYNLSKQYNKTIKHENWETGGKFGKLIYGVTGRKYIYKTHQFWKFKGCRNFTRLISKTLKEFPARFKHSIEKRSLV